MKTPLLAALLCVAAAPAFANLITPINNSFELPAQALHGFHYYTGLQNGWTYGSAGVSSNGGPWYAGSAPDGTQAAFCQSNGCSISQSVSGFTVGEDYTVSFLFAERSGYPAIGIDVILGGVDLGTYTPAGTAFSNITTTSMTATATTMTLEFLGSGLSGDKDTALDVVTISGGVPEPSTAGLLFLGCAGLAALRRFRRRLPHVE